MRIEARPLRWLTTQAVQDASQRRLVPAVLVISVLSLFMMDSCTSCNANVVVEGEPQSMDLSSLAGLLTFGLRISPIGEDYRSSKRLNSI